MTRRRWARRAGRALLVPVLVPVLVLVAGCATRPLPGALDPALFTPAAAAPAEPAPGRLALVVPATLREQVAQGERRVPAQVRVQIGRIVEHAMLTAAGLALRDGAQAMDTPPAAGSGHGATLVIDAVQLQFDDRLLWLLPMPSPMLLIGDREIALTLVIEASLRDAQGQPVWSRRYDSGREVWHHPTFWSAETAPAGLVRLAHQTAWRLAQQALADVRDWLQAERLKPRQF